MKIINKDDCSQALNNIKMYGGINIPLSAIDTFDRLIEEHFSPRSLKFEEIKAGMYVWDNVYESVGRVDRVLTNCNCRRLHNRYSGGGDIVDYEENRYYPIQIPIVGDNNEKHI